MSWTDDHDPGRQAFGAGALPVSRYTLIPAREIIERPGGVRIALTPRVAAILRANGLAFEERFGRESEPTQATDEPVEAPLPRAEDTTGRTRRERRRR